MEGVYSQVTSSSLLTLKMKVIQAIPTPTTKDPIKNKPVSPTLFFVGIFKFHKTKNGSTKIATSDIVLIIAGEARCTSWGRQEPLKPGGLSP